MEQTFDFLNDKALIVFKDDTGERLPVVVKYNGETRRKLSALTKQVDNSKTNTNTVNYTSDYNKSLRKLQVSGATTQDGTPTLETPIPIENANDNGMGIVVRGTNLCDYNIIEESAYDEKLVDVYDEVAGITRKCLAYSCAGRKMVIEGGFKENTQYTVSYFCASQPTSTSTGRPFCFWYTDGTFSYGGYVATTTHNFTRLRVTSTAGKTVSAVGVPNYNNNSKVYVDIDTFLLYEGAISDPIYEPYFRETIEIPTRIDVDGEVVSLRFANYKNADYLLMEKGEVKYYQYSTEGDPTKPLTEQLENIPPIKYDLTSTDLGKQILNLTNKIPYGTIYLEVNSDLTVPITVMYAEWGGRTSE